MRNVASRPMGTVTDVMQIFSKGHLSVRQGALQTITIDSWLFLYIGI